MSQRHDDLRRAVESNSTLDPDVRDELLAEIDRQAAGTPDTATSTLSRTVAETLLRDLGRARSGEG